MGKEKHEHEVVICPVGRFFLDLERVSGRKSKFFRHMNQSRIEFLKAIRSLVDERIERLEKAETEDREGRMTKIPVE